MKLSISLNAVIRILIETYPTKDISMQPSVQTKGVIWLYIDSRRYLMYNLNLNEIHTYEQELKDLFEKAIQDGRSNAADLFMATQNDENLIIESLSVSKMDV